MRREHEWIDELIRAWVAKIEDESLIGAWETLCKERRAQLIKERTFTSEELLASLRGCKHGSPLYADKRIKFPIVNDDGEETRTRVVYLYRYMPRNKVVWVCPTKECRRADARSLSADDVYFYQLGRTEIEVRRRAMKAHHKQPTAEVT